MMKKIITLITIFFISENLSTSIEIGYGNVDLLNYDFAVTSFGFGLHYNFGD